MELNQLEAFLAVAQNKSFSRAAEKLFITQPAVSKRIAGLETQLNCRLFARIGHRIKLTETGQALLGRAQRIVLDWEDSRRMIQNLTGKVSGRIHFATSHHIGLHRLPLILKQFNKKYPEVELELKFHDSETACKKVALGEIEFAVATLPLQQHAPLISTPVWQDPLWIVTGKNHPLNKHKFITAKQLAAYPAVLPDSGTVTRTIIELAFGSIADSFDVKLTTNNLETIKMLVGINMAWSVLPRTLMDQSLKALKVRKINMSRQLGIVQHRDMTLSNAALTFIRLLK